MKTYPQTTLIDLLQLGTKVMGRQMDPAKSFDFGEVMTEWLREMTVRYKSPNIVLNLFVRQILLVTDRELSARILEGAPSSQGYESGTIKAKAMSFLAPNALVIAKDEQWRVLRRYNEAVLETGERTGKEAFLSHVHDAFGLPVQNIEDIRRAMGRTMLDVVFGKDVAPERLIDDIVILFGEVNVKTALKGSQETERREQFYQTLGRLWSERDESTPPSLLTAAHQSRGQVADQDISEEVFLQQIPHWMFTFTGAGTDLLARTLTLITSRLTVYAQIQEEIAQMGAIDEASTIEQLDYLEACLMEACRLYPPVSQTSHRASQSDSFKNKSIPEGTEILQLFPLQQRNSAVDPRANHFYPERWLNAPERAAALYPNLMLSGARTCPGRSLILFICKAAIAVLVEKHGIQGGDPVLSRDPIPFSIPEEAIQFTKKF